MDASFEDADAGYPVYLLVARTEMAEPLRAAATQLGRSMPVAGRRVVKEGYYTFPVVGGRDDGWRTGSRPARDWR
jgi:hypothetical protein